MPLLSPQEQAVLPPAIVRGGPGSGRKDGTQGVANGGGNGAGKAGGEEEVAEVVVAPPTTDPGEIDLDDL